MEDLAISPWENSQYTSQINLFEFRQKTASKLGTPHPHKNRYAHTESNNQSNFTIQKHNILLQSIYKRKPSSTHQHFYHSPQIKPTSKRQLKLVAFPIQQISNQRQKGIRLSQKFQAKSKFLNQSFELIETVYNSELKLLRVFKQKSPPKFYTVNEKSFKQKFDNKNLTKASQSFEKLKNYMRENYDYKETKNNQIQRYKDQQMKFLGKNKEKMQKIDQSTKKQQIANFIFNKNNNLRLHNLDLPQLNRTLDDKKLYQTNLKDNWKQQRQKSKKNKERMNKMSVQKLENINCFRDTTNIFTKLQKKNKVLFNELEKYNLFGLKTFKNKSIVK